jgi:hypothetical protein
MAGPASDRTRAVLGVVLVAGLVLRVLLAIAAPRWGYAWDHFDILGMGLVAGERGITRVYSADPKQLPTLRGHVVWNGQSTIVQRRCVHPPNYPPLSQVVFWLQSRWLGAGDPAFVANTPTTRLVTSLAPWLFELATAIGVALVTHTLTGAPGTAAAAGALTWLAPPLMMNSGLFGQYDAHALAPAVFALLFLVRGRWAVAGFFLGLGLLLKPQGLLMVPVAAFAAWVGAVADRASGVVPTARRLAIIAAVAAVTVALGSAPWMLADGLAWIDRCYRFNLFEVLPYTTLEAYNVWYLLALVSERRPVFDVLLSTTPMLGLTRDAWGRILLVIALAATAALCGWRRRSRPALAVVLFAGLALWAVFIWPTRVHERYVLYCLPPMMVAAAALPRLRLVVATLALIATMEHSWMIWRSDTAVGTFDRRAVEGFHDQRFRAYWNGRPSTLENVKAAPQLEESITVAFESYRRERARSDGFEWMLVLLSLGAYAGALVIVRRSA